MSFDGHVLCQRMLIGPCDFAIIGKPSAAAPPVTPPTAFKKRRRIPVDSFPTALLTTLLLRVMASSPEWSRVATEGRPVLEYFDGRTANTTAADDRPPQRAYGYGDCAI